MQIGLSKVDDKGPETLYELQSLKPHKEGFIAQIKGVQDRNHSEEIAKSFVFIDQNVLQSEVGEMPFLHEFLNFSVFDGPSCIGTVTGFDSNGAQDLILVSLNETLFEIPFVSDFISEIDYTTKTIKFQLPPGLLELNEKR